MRAINQIYPDYTAEIAEIEKNGISDALLNQIIHKHRRNAAYNKRLHDRYCCYKEGVPIASRRPRYDDGDVINNRLHNDFFSESIDFVVGYMCGVPIAYSYADTTEAEEETGGKQAVEAATKAITDFIVRSNLHDVDMETTKNLLISGYAGRLFYVDEDGNERAMVVPSYECIILSKVSVSEPQYGIRYYPYWDIHGVKRWKAEFYDAVYRYCYDGTWGALKQDGEPQPHMFALCPLVGIAANAQMLGHCEKVLALIDDYDKCMSDVSNDLEAFANAHMVFENVTLTEQQKKEAQHSAVINFPPSGTQPGKVSYLTKQMDISAVSNHLDRLEKNIYRFTHTPNLDDSNMGDSSGQALKHRLLGLETKCGMIQAKMESAIFYMWRVLASAWEKKKIRVEPLQCVCTFKRNFPLNIINDAGALQALLNTGFPLKEAIAAALPWVDDPDYIVQLMENERNSIPALDGFNEGIDNGEETETADA